MAAPADVTIKNLSGEFTMDKSISTPVDAILALQGMGWMLRKALSFASLTLKVHAYPDSDDPKLLHIDIDQIATGGIQGTTENRILDWTPREHKDHIFGTCAGQSRVIRGVKGEDGKVRPNVDVQTKVDDEKIKKFLQGDIDVDGAPSDGFIVDEEGEEYGEGEGLWAQNFVVNKDSGWTAEQVWGFENINGQRYYTRRVVVASKDGKFELGRLVYTFLKKRAE